VRPLKVMILDDEPIVGRHLKPTLSKYGIDAEVFEDPDKAVARINETEFDVVVTDIRMKGMDGLKVLEWIRSRSAHTRVIIITAYGSREVEKEALIGGAFAFITKPFKPRDLRHAIDRAVRALGHPGIEPPEGTGL
jgi:DNA-binding NtrC family response regulator